MVRATLALVLFCLVLMMKTREDGESNLGAFCEKMFCNS